MDRKEASLRDALCNRGPAADPESNAELQARRSAASLTVPWAALVPVGPRSASPSLGGDGLTASTSLDLLSVPGVPPSSRLCMMLVTGHTPGTWGSQSFPAARRPSLQPVDYTRVLRFLACVLTQGWHPASGGSVFFKPPNKYWPQEQENVLGC